MSSLRNFLYRLARFLGDVTAVRKGRIGQRIHNRMVGKGIGKLTRKLWR
jgi:hypothetical protein